jgi:hypothetical protein
MERSDTPGTRSQKQPTPQRGGSGFVARVVSGTPCRGAVPGGAAFRRYRFAQPSATFWDASGIGSSTAAGSSGFLMREPWLVAMGSHKDVSRALAGGRNLGMPSLGAGYRGTVGGRGFRGKRRWRGGRSELCRRSVCPGLRRMRRWDSTLATSPGAPYRVFVFFPLL